MGMRKKKKKSSFLILYILFVLALLTFWIAIFFHVRDCLTIYEASQPEHVAERFAAQMEREGQASPYLQIRVSRFEDEAACRTAHLPDVSGKGVTCERSPESYNANFPTYGLYCDGALLARVSLKERSTRPLMLILSVSEWEVAEISPEIVEGTRDLTIKIPDTYSVSVNGITLDDREFTGNRWELGEFQYCAEYTDVPELVEYRIEGLFEEPEVEIYDARHESIDFFMGEGRTIVVETFQTSVMEEELETYVLENAKNYSNFFSGDLTGSSASTAPIRYMFPEESYYLEMAENYRLHDMWMYSGHETPVFQDEKVTNYTVYNEDFFSCEVYFDKKMILSKTRQERHDIHNNRYYYARIEGKWLIVDMQAVQ